MVRALRELVDFAHFTCAAQVGDNRDQRSSTSEAGPTIEELRLPLLDNTLANSWRAMSEVFTGTTFAPHKSADLSFPSSK